MRTNLLRCDHGGQRVITTNSDTHDNTPEDQKTSGRDRGRAGRKRLGKGSKDHDDQFKAIHALATNAISEPSEEELTDNSATRGRNLDSSVDAGGDLAREVNNTNHADGKIDSEDIISISEETHTGDDDSTDVAPAELGVVDAVKGMTAALKGILIGVDERRNLNGRGSLVPLRKRNSIIRRGERVTKRISSRRRIRGHHFDGLKRQDRRNECCGVEKKKEKRRREGEREGT